MSAREREQLQRKREILSQGQQVLDNDHEDILDHVSDLSLHGQFYTEDDDGNVVATTPAEIMKAEEEAERQDVI